MDLFNTNTEFVDYIFSLQWRENDPCIIESWPQGKFALSDLINHLEQLSNDVLLALYSDILFKANAKKFEELSRVYPQEIFINLYENELQQHNIERWIEQKFPIANYILQYIYDQIKANIKPNSTQRADTPKEVILYDELDTPEANKYFARAVEAGYMKPTATGGEWLTAVVRLGYVCSKIFQQPRPIAALEKYFGVTKLSASITQASIEAVRADVKKWRAEIDTKIFYD